MYHVYKMISDSEFSYKIFQSIHEIPQEEWNKIFPPISESYNFLKTIEETFSQEYKFLYIALYKKTEIVYLAPFFISEYCLDTTIKGPFKKITSSVRKWIPKFLTLRVLISGSPTSLGNAGIKTEHIQELTPLFNQTVNAIAQKEHANIIGFKDFGEEYTDFLDVLRPIGYHKVRSFPSVRLKIKFKSFDEYLASLSKPTRKGLRKKLNKSKEIPIEMKVQDNLGPWLDQAYGLYCQTLNKSEIQFEIVPKEFFERIGTHCSKKSKFFLWFLDGKLIAFDLCLARDGILIDKYIGLDYEVAYKYHLYFLTFHDIVNWCLANGITTYEGGALNYTPKKHLDFDFSPQYIYCRHLNPILNIFLGLLTKLLKPENFDPIIKLKYQNLRILEKEKNSSWSIYLLILITVIIQSLSELLFKQAALSTNIHIITLSNLGHYIHQISSHVELWAGLMFYILNFFVWITVLSRSDLSFAFPVASISYILIPLLSVIFLHERTNFLHWLGIFLITFGITLVIQSNNRKEAKCP